MKCKTDKFFNKLSIALITMCVISLGPSLVKAQDIMEDIFEEESLATPSDTLNPIDPVELPNSIESSVQQPPSQLGLETTNTVNTSSPNITEIDPDLYFDSENLVPQSELSAKGNPRRVNPKLQPASRFIVVNSEYSSDSIEAKLVAADRALKLGRYAAALEFYNELIAKNDKDTRFLLGKATTLQQMGRDDEAIDAYQALLEVDKDHLDAHINMLGLVSEKYPATALQRLLLLEDKNPDNLTLLSQIAYVLAKVGRYEQALEKFSYVSGLEPRNANHVMNMGIIADQAGMTDRAVQYYEEALNIDTIYGGGRSIPRGEIFDRLATLR